MRKRNWAAGMVLAALGWGVPRAPAEPLLLLTDNGLNNPEFTEYKGANVLPTNGSYTAIPPFDSGPGAGGQTPFAAGALTNGDATFHYQRDPHPYSYWQNLAVGELVFDLGRPCRVRRVRVCVLNSGPHGTERLELYRGGDPLEFPDLLRIGGLQAANGWNEWADLDVVGDGLRLLLTRAAGKSYITLSEVEIWGTPLADAEAGAGAPPTRRQNPRSIREDGIEWYAFDFGPAAAPVFAHFTGVSKDDRYSADKGFGWLPYQDGKPMTPSNFGPESSVVPGLGDRDRGEKKGSSWDSLFRDLVMTSRYYHSQVRQTFVLDVPPGRYRVISFHGDPVYGTPGEQCWWVEAEGTRVVEKLSLPASLLADAVFDTEVRDGQLTLTFDAEHPDPAKCGFIANGLAVFPANSPAELAFADEKIGKIRAALERERRQGFERRFRETPYVETAPMPPVSEEDRARGYVPFVPHWMTNVFPNSVPRAADLTRPLACFACPGEFEPLTVAVRTLRTLKNLRCEPGDLDGAAGRIPASAIEVRTVKCWPQRLGSSWSTEWRVMPELLERRPGVDVPVDTSQQFWLTIRVPPDAAAGVYEGRVTLAADDAGRTVMPVRVEVLPFRLEKSERPVGMYWYEHKVKGTPARDLQVRDMVEHGMRTLTLGHLFPEMRLEDGRLVLDTAELAQFLRELRVLGIEGPIPYHCSALMTRVQRLLPGAAPEEHDRLYVEAIRQLQAVGARPDSIQLLFYPVDEIGNHEERGRKAQHECGLISRVPGAVSYITVNDYASGEKWGDTFDIWCGNVDYTPEQEQRLLARGKRYMRYGSAYLNDPRRARASSGFGFYRRPAEAMFYWHYQAAVGDPYNDFDGDSRDWCAAYPGPDGEPIPTTDWEGLREGVDDLRYIATLKHYAALAAQTADGAEAARQALQTLEEVLGGEDRVGQTVFRDDLGPDEYHGLRRRLVDQILRLLPLARR